VCGEQREQEHAFLREDGLSPRVRGTAAYAPPGDRYTRFIPACAGNRKMNYNSNCLLTVHPRVCGEQEPMKQSRLAMRGSSPRVRGTGVDYLRDDFVYGSSPRVRGTGDGPHAQAAD